MTDSGNRLKVLGCITELDVGGAEKAFVRVLSGLKSRGWEVEAVSLRDSGPLASELLREQIPVTALNCGGLWDLRAFWRLKRLVQSSKPDVVLSFLHQANLYGRLAACSHRQAVVVSGIRVADRRRTVTWLDRWTSGRVDQYVGVSQQVMNSHAKWCGLSPSRCEWIPNGVDLPEKLQEAERATDRLLFVGRLTEQKSPQTLLDAFSQLQSQGNNLTLQIVGDGPLRSALQQQASRLNIDQSVQFLGQRTDVPKLMQKATVFVLPSLWEGMPNVVLEAMANGLPVVCSDVDGIRDVVTDRRTGMLTRPGDADSVMAALTELLGDATFCRKMADSAYQVVSQRFSWDDIVEQYDTLLRRLAASRSR